MWQVLLAAAIAGGSGYLTNKHIFHKKDNNNPCVENADDETPSIFMFSSAANGSTNSPKKSGCKKGKNGKKFAVCLKKRRTGRNASAKCDITDAKGNQVYVFLKKKKKNFIRIRILLC